MDSTLFGYQSLSNVEYNQILHDIKKSTKNITILWHNSQVEHLELYINLINCAN